jgi:CubicO group peptidase (beta-lactamase class C family)
MKADAVHELLKRGVGAGVAPAAIAEWGRVGGETRSRVVGSARQVPVRETVSDRTWFDLASLTKPVVTTTLAMLAFRKGKLALETTVGEVLDELRGADVGNLDIGQLLTHTSGLPAWLPLYCLAEGDPERLVERLDSVRLVETPGDRVVYSCVGFVILGMMLERTFGSDLASIFRHEVTGKLGIDDELGFHPDPGTHSLSDGATSPVVESRLVNQFGFDQRWIPPMAPGLPDDGNARFLGGTAGNAGLFGTAAGVFGLAKEFLGGTLFNRDEIDMATILRTEGLEQARALGWQIASSPGCSAGPSLSPAAFGHTGFTGVSVWIDPEIEGVFVLLTNRNHPGQRENDLHPFRRRFHTLARESLA